MTPSTSGEDIHAAKALDAAAMGEPHHHGLGLVAEMVGGGKDIGAILAHGVADGTVAEGAGGGLKCRPWALLRPSGEARARNPRRVASRTTIAASSAASGRRPWSTV